MPLIWKFNLKSNLCSTNNLSPRDVIPLSSLSDETSQNKHWMALTSLQNIVYTLFNKKYSLKLFHKKHVFQQHMSVGMKQ